MEGLSGRRKSTCQVLVGRKHELKAEKRPMFLEQREQEHGVRGSWRGQQALSRQAS